MSSPTALIKISGGAMSADRSAVNTLRIVQHWSDHLSELLGYSMSADLASKAVEKDLTLLGLIQEPAERRLALIAIGQIAEKHPEYEKELARQSAAIATEVRATLRVVHAHGRAERSA